MRRQADGTLHSDLRARFTFSRMPLALAVQMNSFGFRINEKPDALAKHEYHDSPFAVDTARGKIRAEKSQKHKNPCQRLPRKAISILVIRN